MEAVVVTPACMGPLMQWLSIDFIYYEAIALAITIVV